ncbi:hypothetical protein E4U21_005298 [Claviceps maximensis]|nr:hypothetical protein E4U21_005298 [Claviceps maximensis]
MALDDQLQLQIQLHIDNLLQRHLTLLDQYTHLRKRLSQLHSSTLQNIARANFSAQRGQRFGQDQYDGRMKASRRVAVKAGEGEPVSFCVVRGVDGGEGCEGNEGSEGGEGNEGNEREEDNEGKEDNEGGEEEEDKKREEKNMKNEEDKPPTHKREHDPLRWFGILTPPPLRAAQTHAVEAVEEVIPQLVSVAAEMEYLEIEVRRARKKRDKAQGKGKNKGNSMEGKV